MSDRFVRRTFAEGIPPRVVAEAFRALDRLSTTLNTYNLSASEFVGWYADNFGEKPPRGIKSCFVLCSLASPLAFFIPEIVPTVMLSVAVAGYCLYRGRLAKAFNRSVQEQAVGKFNLQPRQPEQVPSSMEFAH